jgi:hypothetical protein
VDVRASGGAAGPALRASPNQIFVPAAPVAAAPQTGANRITSR